MAKKTVLAVEDDDEIRAYLEVLIAELGYEPLTAPDGETALKLFDSRTVDIVFTDIAMPGMTGFELAERLRRQNAAIPVICTSGYNHIAPDNCRCLRFLRKPYRPADLEMALAQV